MSRLNCINVFTVVLFFVLSINKFVPVDSIVYSVSYQANKMFLPCKNSKYSPIQEYVDLTQLKFKVDTENTLLVQGSYAFIKDIPKGFPVKIVTTGKHKVRGRWMDVPYTHVIGDLCAIYLQKGTFYYDSISQYFTQEQRQCPAPKNLRLPVNCTLSLDLDSPALVPEGEYMSISVLTVGKIETCFEFYMDAHQK